MIREIPSSEWHELPDRFIDTHRAWLTTLHQVNREGRIARIHSAPFGAVRLEVAEASASRWPATGQATGSVK